MPYGEAADRPDLTTTDPGDKPDWWPPDQPWPPPPGTAPGTIPINIPPGTIIPPNGGSAAGLPHGTPPAGWTPQYAPGTAPPPVAGPAGPGGPASPGGALAGGLGANQFFGPPPKMIDLGGPPGLTYLPPPPNFDATKPQFTAPTAADALNDPGYKFRVDQGDNGLQQWAGAKGTLNDSSTAKALEDYNQNAASQEYSQVWNRNYGVYQGALDAWNTGTVQPGMTAYTTTAAAGQHQNDLNYLDYWNKGVFNTDFAKWWATQ